MSTWSIDDVLGNRLDFEIVRDGFVRTLRDRVARRDAENWLRSEGYRVVRMDAGSWRDDRAMHQDFAATLGFPGYYGRNLDALDDCLSDVAEAAYGWVGSETGLVLVLEGFETFTQRSPRTSEALRDILPRQSRYGSLFGNRILTLLS